MNDYTGYIFKWHGSYWKITGPKYKAGTGWGEDYPVIKCTMYGKEFTRTTRFCANVVESLTADELWKSSYDTAVSVSTTGKETGAKKRRVLFLEAKIAAFEAKIATYTKELEELKAELGC